MITSEMISRINELARKQRETGLTDEECTEQAALRRKYIDGIKEQVRNQLKNVTYAHDDHCECGCHDHKHHH